MLPVARLPVFPRFVCSFQAFDKPAEIRWIDIVEPTEILFEFKILNINVIRPEVVEVSRDESELLVLRKIVTGIFVVALCLFIGACLHGFLLFESPIR